MPSINGKIRTNDSTWLGMSICSVDAVLARQFILLPWDLNKLHLKVVCLLLHLLQILLHLFTLALAVAVYLICDYLRVVVYNHICGSCCFGEIQPASKVSYSASLLVVGKSSRTMHSISSPSREWSTIPTPPACLLDNLFVWILYWGYALTPYPSLLVNSAMKLATTYPFMAICGRYCMSNSLNFIAHSAICPTALGLLITLHRGLSVRTTIVWAWKYSLSLRAVVTNAKASFSIRGTSFRHLGVLD